MIVFSSSVLSSFGLPLPSTCLILTVNEARSYFASTIAQPDYRLDGRGLIPAEAKDFPSSLWVQTGSEVHPASYPMGTGGPFPGVKCGRSLTDH
jgi:hypothetical protein